MKDKFLKVEEVKVPHTLGGSSYTLRLHNNSTKEVVRHLKGIPKEREEDRR